MARRSRIRFGIHHEWIALDVPGRVAPDALLVEQVQEVQACGRREAQRMLAFAVCLHAPLERLAGVPWLAIRAGERPGVEAGQARAWPCRRTRTGEPVSSP